MLALVINGPKSLAISTENMPARGRVVIEYSTEIQTKQKNRLMMMIHTRVNIPELNETRYVENTKAKREESCPILSHTGGWRGFSYALRIHFSPEASFVSFSRLVPRMR